MKLQTKVILILTSMWVVISLFLYIDSRVTLSRKYEALEQQQMTADIERAHHATQNMLYILSVLNTDWSQWDDAYQFMQDKNQKFISTNLSYTTFKDLRINFMLFFAANKKLYYGKSYNLARNEFVPIPASLLNYVQQHPALLMFKDIHDVHASMIKIPEGYLAVSVEPITTSAGKGLARGAILLAYYVNQTTLNELAKTLDMKIQFYPLPLDADNPLVKTASAQLQTGTKYYVQPINKKIMNGFTYIRDFEHKPIAILGVEIPRVLYAEGLMTIKHYLIIILSLGIIVLIAVWYLLKILVLDRLISVSKQVVKINSQSKFSNRIMITGNDEINKMVSAFNSLMEIIELTQEQLRYRILQRTEKLERLSALNKNLFHEIHKQKEVENRVRQEEQKKQTDDMIRPL